MSLVNLIQCLHDTFCTFFRALQELHEQPIDGAFHLAFVGHKAVRQDVVFGCRKTLDGAVSAVMIRENKSVLTHHDAGAEVSEIDHTVLEACMFSTVELVGRKLQAKAFHGCSRFLVNTIQHPHAFVGTGKGCNCA